MTVIKSQYVLKEVLLPALQALYLRYIDETKPWNEGADRGKSFDELTEEQRNDYLNGELGPEDINFVNTSFRTGDVMENRIANFLFPNTGDDPKIAIFGDKRIDLKNHPLLKQNEAKDALVKEVAEFFNKFSNHSYAFDGKKVRSVLRDAMKDLHFQQEFYAEFAKPFEDRLNVIYNGQKKVESEDVLIAVDQDKKIKLLKSFYIEHDKLSEQAALDKAIEYADNYELYKTEENGEFKYFLRSEIGELLQLSPLAVDIIDTTASSNFFSNDFSVSELKQETASPVAQNQNESEENLIDELVNSNLSGEEMAVKYLEKTTIPEGIDRNKVISSIGKDLLTIRFLKNNLDSYRQNYLASEKLPAFELAINLKVQDLENNLGKLKESLENGDKIELSGEGDSAIEQAANSLADSIINEATLSSGLLTAGEKNNQNLEKSLENKEDLRSSNVTSFLDSKFNSENLSQDNNKSAEDINENNINDIIAFMKNKKHLNINIPEKNENVINNENPDLTELFARSGNLDFQPQQSAPRTLTQADLRLMNGKEVLRGQGGIPISYSRANRGQAMGRKILASSSNMNKPEKPGILNSLNPLRNKNTVSSEGKPQKDPRMHADSQLSATSPKKQSTNPIIKTVLAASGVLGGSTITGLVTGII